MTENPTVWSERIEDLPAIKMVWVCDVDVPDVRVAFQDITKILNASETPLYVIVDIQCNPKFPIAETVIHAMAGPFRNPKLIEWLVVGNNKAARTIEGLLSRVTGRSNVRWFDSEAGAIAFLDNIKTQAVA